MKKLFFVLLLISSIFSTAQAGYIIRSVSGSINPSFLRNYTLTFDVTGNPVAAASMPYNGIYSIVIVHANSNAVQIFPTNIGITNLPIEIRDFHRISNDDAIHSYILCGSRGTGANARAFVATIDGSLSTMRFMEYTEANIFYSIWGDIINTPIPNSFGFYACGTKDNNGVIDGIIANVDRTNLNLLNYYRNEKWEYHKIILKENSGGASIRFVVSGRSPDYSHIGYTEFLPIFAATNYYWAQQTEPDSHCVVSDNGSYYNQVILASSYQNVVTLTSVNISFSPVTYYHFANSPDKTFYVQDISVINDAVSISVAGYTISSQLPSQHQAWHGYVTGLSFTSSMRNNFYYGSSTQLYEHYKVRYNNGVAYTGGYFQDLFPGDVLFATPLVSAEKCDHIEQSPYGFYPYFPASSPVPLLYPYLIQSYHTILPSITQSSYIECEPFKWEISEPELVMPAEEESEITAFYDHITVKDTPMNTNYQIYSITGQLIQTGATNPDISTAQLSRGFYILRLENGKAFKFVK